MTTKLSSKVWLIAGIVLLALGAASCLLLGGLVGWMVGVGLLASGGAAVWRWSRR